MTGAEKIKNIREKHNLTQEELGKIVGLTNKAISAWENEGKVPRMGCLEKLSAYFKCSKSEFLDDDFLNSPSLSLTSEETEIITIYHSLDDMGKSIIKGELYKQKLRCDSIENK